MYNQEEYQSLILAALLHDIGKFYQRTGRFPKYFTEFTPEDYGEHGAHSKWSASFVQEFLPKFSSGIAVPILYHHKPQDEFSKIINRADLLSSSERISSYVGDPYRLRLLPVLGRVFRPDWKEKGYYLNPLSLDKNVIFPNAPAYSDDLTVEYARLWDLFITEISLLKEKQNFNAYLWTLLYILQKYTWCIPSAAYKSEPDISLFDHLKATAAVSAVLYNSSSSIYRVIGGDISGVQRFLYKLFSPDEAQAGMAQRLRGRSFYISLLVETIALFILESLELPITNLLWCGGGNFTILGSSKNDLSEIEAKIDKWLLDKYQGEIACVIANIDIDESGLTNFGVSLNLLHNELSKKKLRKFQNLAWHQPFNIKNDVCRICGMDSDKKNCDECIEHEKIGQKIPYSKYLFIVPAYSTVNKDVLKINFDELGIVWGLTSSSDNITSNAHVVYNLKDTDINLGERLPNTAVGFKFLAWKVAKSDNKILTFEEMQSLSKGAEFLGSLRMDVDDLGLIFCCGLGGNRSLSRIASLSRAIELFFGGYLNKIAENMASTYILYSGGDDLFIVSSWNDAIEMSTSIYLQFKEYTGNNPNMHISAGIHLHKHKFPIGIAASLAKEKLEGMAKMNQRNGKEKDSLAVFEFPVFWSDALPAIEFGKWLTDLIESKNLSHKFIYNILQIYWTYFKDDGKENQGWVPKFLYHLKRNVPAKDKSGKENVIYGEFLTRMPLMIKTTPLWGTFALLSTREKKGVLL